MGNIIWLASYFKSGNTWLRVFLTNLLYKTQKPADINNIINLIASSRTIFDDLTGIESSDLSIKEINKLRPKVYQYISDDSLETQFYKAHDAYHHISDSEPLFPPKATRGILYVIRNPLDVAVSYAHHQGLPVQRIIEIMKDETYTVSYSEKGISKQLPQLISSWSNHVESWTSAKDQKILVIRFEDMKTHPRETFGKIVRFLDLDFNDEDIMEAIQKSSFSELRNQEEQKGFKERSSKSSHFFRKGEIGLWKEVLNQVQVSQIIKDHKDVMKKYHYLDNDHH